MKVEFIPTVSNLNNSGSFLMSYNIECLPTITRVLTRSEMYTSVKYLDGNLKNCYVARFPTFSLLNDTLEYRATPWIPAG